jgi:hypothetical protein
MSDNEPLTAANNGPLMEERAADGRFIEGWRGGPGKPAGKTFATRCREAIEAAVTPEDYEQTAKSLLGIATRGKKRSDRIAAAKLLFEFAGVLAPVKVDAVVSQGPTVQEEINAGLEEWRKQIEAEGQYERRTSLRP